MARVIVRYNRLPAKIRQAEREIETILQAIALDGERDVKQSFGTSPSPPGGPPGVDTGTLRNSIHVRKPAAKVRLIEDGVEYGIMLEFGTRRMGARPFMGPMADRLARRIPHFFDNFLD